MRKHLLTMLLVMTMLSVTACGKEPASNDAGSLSQAGPVALAETETDTEETLQEPESDIEPVKEPAETPKPTEAPKNAAEPAATPIVTAQLSGTAAAATDEPAMTETPVVVAKTDTAAAETTPEPAAPLDKPVDAPATPAPTEAPASGVATTDSGHVHNIVYNWMQEEEVGQCVVHVRCVDICGDCGYIQRVIMDYGEMSSCTLGEQVWVTQPTCTTRGEYYQYCTKCGKEGNHNFTVGEPSHLYIQIESYYSVTPTCVTDGIWTKTYQCKECEDTYTEEENVGKIDTHSPTRGYDVAPRTCTDSGTYMQVCMYCGTEMGVVPDRTVEAIGHYDDNGDGSCDRCGSGM